MWCVVRFGEEQAQPRVTEFAVQENRMVGFAFAAYVFARCLRFGAGCAPRGTAPLMLFPSDRSDKLFRVVKRSPKHQSTTHNKAKALNYSFE